VIAATRSLDALDAGLLNRVQDDFPLCPRPFLALAEEVGTSEADVLRRLAAARESGVLRQVSAIFDTNALGYRSSLVAMRVEPQNLNQAAHLINSHPGVSHNYRRKRSFWSALRATPGRGTDNPPRDGRLKVRKFTPGIDGGCWTGAP
jgi:siroheme decarboxylase